MDPRRRVRPALSNVSGGSYDSSMNARDRLISAVESRTLVERADVASVIDALGRSDILPEVAQYLYDCGLEVARITPTPSPRPFSWSGWSAS